MQFGQCQFHADNLEGIKLETLITTNLCVNSCTMGAIFDSCHAKNFLNELVFDANFFLGKLEHVYCTASKSQILFHGTIFLLGNSIHGMARIRNFFCEMESDFLPNVSLLVVTQI